MPVFNAESTLQQSVASVISQTFPEWELLLVDDASSDNSANICDCLSAKDSRIRTLRQPKNSGAGLTRNAGIRAARGRFIAFLDADDEWHAEKLERQMAFMVRKKAVFSYTGFWRVKGAKRRRVQVPEGVGRKQLLRGNVIGCLTVMYDRQYFGTVQMPALPMRQDFAFWLELLERTDLAHGLNEPLASHYCRPNSLTSRRGQALAATWQMYRRYFRYSAPRSAWYMSNHLLRRLARR